MWVQAWMQARMEVWTQVDMQVDVQVHVQEWRPMWRQVWMQEWGHLSALVLGQVLLQAQVHVVSLWNLCQKVIVVRRVTSGNSGRYDLLDDGDTLIAHISKKNCRFFSAATRSSVERSSQEIT